MSKHSRRPKRSSPSRELAPIHLRDPVGNERSVCNAEERATYCGDNVICTTEAAYVTCGSCKKWIAEVKQLKAEGFQVRVRHDTRMQKGESVADFLRRGKP